MSDVTESHGRQGKPPPKAFNPNRNAPPHDHLEMLSHARDVMAGHVRPGVEHNVYLGSQYWARENPSKPVSLIGALLLTVQPAPDDDDHAAAPDPMHTAAHAMGCAALWLEGVADGYDWAKADDNRLAQWPESDHRSQQYRQGVAAGLELRKQEGRATK